MIVKVFIRIGKSVFKGKLFFSFEMTYFGTFLALVHLKTRKYQKSTTSRELTHYKHYFW